MNCNEIKDMMSSYIDGELDENEKKLIKEHIDNCDDCKKEFESYIKLTQVLKNIPDEEPPKGYCKRLHEKLLNVRQDKKITDMFSNRRWIKYASIAAIIVLIFPVLYFQSLRMGNSAKSEIAQDNSAMQSTGMAPAAQSAPYSPMEAKNSVNYDMAEKSTADAVKPADGQNGLTGETKEKEMKIVKSSSISAETENYDEFLNLLIDKVNFLGGFVEQNNTNVYNVYENKKLKYGYLIIRVPEDKFNELISFIEQNSDVNQKNISEIDQTKEYYEKDNQVKNLQAQETQLRALFEKAKTVEEMLLIENELKRVRTEIDSLNISIKDIDDRSSMSTISLEVREVLPANFNITDTDNVWERAKEGFINTVNGIVEGLENLVVAIISLSPILIPFIIILIIVFIRIRKNKKPLK